jgi:threonylcarbamoyladenosine tRNA methylthiotransferase MtaB
MNLEMNKGPVTVSVTTLGCKSNQYDSGAIEESLLRGGLKLLPFPARAEAYVINTCTVTRKTDYQSRQLIRRVRKINPAATVIVTGCYAQVSPDELSGIEGVDYILGNPEKDKVLEYVLKEYVLKGSRTGDGAKTMVGEFRSGAPLSLRARSTGGRTRANLKVQDGCDKFCSYCIIPRARGLSKSLPLDDVEREIELLVEAGFKEIVLTGIHLGAYGADLAEKTDLTSILELIEKKAFPCRFRISSLDPDEVTDGFVEVMKTSRGICNHLHLPLQSGDKDVLRRMRRDYTPKIFIKAVESLFETIPGISIGTDVMAGFPGEGPEEFENTFTLLEGLPISYLHIFPYSVRSNTRAASYQDRVNGVVVKERCRKLKILDSSKRKAFYSGFLGDTAEVLIESTRDRNSGAWKGKARNYIPVAVKDFDSRPNTFVNVRLDGLTEDGMTGVGL